MRRIQQAKILEFLQTLREATDELKKQSSWNVLCNLLADMQDFAFQIGQYIESVAGAQTNTIVLLEKFCTILYEMYQNQNVEKYIKWLRSQLRNVENSVRSELRPDKIEVVFFPYQLSMWDSLESVYMAAKADSNCNVYVVPIPWFDKKQNGEFGQMHYDGDQYPKYISITNWQEYDVEARHPDVIYIHNCYDESNYVTSVHPDFYSKRLYKYTDSLIYIPYFVVVDDVPEHFCTTAACIYAHKTIVQSEKIFETYIREFKKNFGNQFGNPKDKFIALGSPKFDAVINAKSEDFNLPEDWCRLIYKTDGTKKTVVLYNTTVTAILQGNEQYLKKLSSVLNIFKGRDDIVLWWRPHPLSKMTLQSMRPHLLEAYENIINSSFYRKIEDGINKKPQCQGSIIFDDSADLHRSIALSDCLLSDNSSVVALYEKTGKPIMIQNVKVNTTNPALRFETMIQIGSEYYFTTMFYNGLFILNTHLATAEYIGSFSGESDSARMFRSISQYKNKLIFVPFSANAVHFYDLKKEEFSSIKLDTYEKPCSETPDFFSKLKFSFCILHNEFAFLFPYSYQAIVKINMETYEIEYLYEPINHFLKIAKPIPKTYHFNSGVVQNKNVVMWHILSNSLIEFNLETETIKEIYSDNSNEQYLEAVYDNKNWWLIPFDNKSNVVKLSADFKVKNHISMPSVYKTDTVPFSNSVYLNGYVWLIAGTANYTIKVDINTLIAETMPIFDIEEREQLGLRPADFLRFTLLGIDNNKLYIYDKLTWKFVEYDTNTCEFNSCFVVPEGLAKEICFSAFDEIIKWNLQTKNSDLVQILESNTFPVDAFITVVSEGHFCNVKGTVCKPLNIPSKTCGQEIYNYVKSKVMNL